MHIEIHSVNVDKEEYLHPSIRMFLTGKNDTPSTVNLLSFNGKVRFEGKVVQNIPLQPLEAIAEPSGGANPGNVYVECSGTKIHEIERLRNGGDLELSIGLTFQMFRKEPSGKGYVQYAREAKVEKKLSQSDWNQILDEMGYGTKRVLEIPNPRVVENRPLQNGIETMEKAMSLLRQGQNEEAFKKSRDVLDAIFPELNKGPSETPVEFSQMFIDQLNKNSTPGVKDDGTSWPNKSEYINNLRKHIRDLSNIGHHGNYRITPEDSELMVYLTWDLISFLSKEYAKSVDEWPQA